MQAAIAAAETLVAALFAVSDPQFAPMVEEAREAALRMLDTLADAGAVDVEAPAVELV